MCKPALQYVCAIASVCVSLRFMKRLLSSSASSSSEEEDYRRSCFSFPFPYPFPFPFPSKDIVSLILGHVVDF